MRIGMMVALAVAAAPASTVEAATLVRLSGYVYYTAGDATQAFRLGDMASASLTFDEDAAGQPWYPGGVLDPSVYFYRNAPTGGSITVGSYTATFSPAARMFVTDQEAGPRGPMDRVLFDDFGATGNALNGRKLDVVSVSWEDDTASALGSLKLADVPGALSRFPAPRASLDWNPYLNAAHRVSVIFTSVDVSAVPEPATWIELLSGLGLTAAALRRTRRAGAASAALRRPVGAGWHVSAT